MVETPFWKLRLLSDYGLSSAEDGAPLALSTRKSLALLAYLVRQPERQASRERLAWLLWEDAPPSQARLNLRKTLSSLRQQTRLAAHPGAALLEANNDAVWLVRDSVASDVEALEQAVSAARAGRADSARAADLYTGDFLSDFAVRGAPAFDAWAVVERQRLRDLAITAMIADMEQCLLPGSAPEAGVVAAMRVLALDPLQERAHRALMGLYVRQGRRSAALKQFHTLSEALQRELSTTPETQTRDLFREISAARHARGPESARSATLTAADVALEAPLAPKPVAARSDRRNMAIAAATVLGLAAVGGVVITAKSPRLASLAAAHREPSIAVLPFSGVGDGAETRLFAEGLTEEVTDSLVQFADLKVSGRTSAFHYKSDDVDLKEVGRTLGVAYVLKGSVRREGERLRVTAQLVEVANGFAIWSGAYDRGLSDAYVLQSEIARSVARELKAGLVEPARQTQSPNGRAYQLYLVARANLRNGGKDELETARHLFRRQLALDPDDARALAGYAQATIALARLSALPFDSARMESETAVARALRIDPLCAEAYLARSQIEDLASIWTNTPGHLSLSLDAAKRAVDLSPRDPDALSFYGYGLLNVGRSDEAIEVLERAVELDPLHRRAQAQLGKAYRSAGLLDRAAEQYRATLELFPDDFAANILLGQAMYERSDAVAAERAFLGASKVTSSPTSALYLATLYANLKMDEEAAAQLSSIQAPPMMAALAQALSRHLARDYRGALALAEAEVARDPESPLRDFIYADAAITGDHAKARRQLAEVAPGLLSAEPDFAAAALDMATIGAHVLNQTGEQAQAQKVISRTLRLAAQRPGRDSLPREWLARINAYAELGQKERALGELRRAIDAGFHDRVDDSILVRLEDWPSLQSLRGDMRFQKMIAEIEGHNRAMKAKLLVSRAAVNAPRRPAKNAP